MKKKARQAPEDVEEAHHQLPNGPSGRAGQSRWQAQGAQVLPHAARGERVTEGRGAARRAGSLEAKEGHRNKATGQEGQVLDVDPGRRERAQGSVHKC